MAQFRHMVSLVRTPEDKEEIAEEMTASKPMASSIPDVPYGLHIWLDEECMEKLEIDYSDCDVGDMIHISAMAEVTSVSCEKTGDKERVRIELSITHMAVEDEDRETEPDDEGGEDDK